MDKLVGLISLEGMGKLLEGEVSTSVVGILNFVIGFAIILVAANLVRKIPPIPRLVEFYRLENKKQFKEGDVILLAVPNKKHRRLLYLFLMLSLFFLMIASAAYAADFVALSFLALSGKNLLVDKFTAFSVLIGFSLFMFSCAYQTHIEVNKLARFLRKDE